MSGSWVRGLILAGAGAYLPGVHDSEQANWHTVNVFLAKVAVDEEGSHRSLGVDVDGWTFAIDDSVLWIGALGHPTGIRVP